MMTMCVQIAERRSHLTLTVSLLRARGAGWSFGMMRISTPNSSINEQQESE